MSASYLDQVGSMDARTSEPPSGPVETRHYDLKIERIENGFLVRAGCKSFCFNDLDSLLKAVNLYYTNITEAKERYCANRPTQTSTPC